MEFKNFELLITKIEEDLGSEFKQNFREGRKKLAGLTNLPNQILFSEFDKDKSEWVYNRGGKKEIQYHIYLRNGELGYGLGINSQRGSFNNDDPKEIANSFGDSFKEIYTEIIKLLPTYTLKIGSEEQLGRMKEEEFILFGNSIPYNNDNKIDDEEYQTLITDLKKQLKVYLMIFELNVLKKEKSLLNEKQMKEKQEYIKILEYKKQIILQGPPGTGKTRQAKLIAKEMLGLTDNEELKDNDQFKLIQFHPSYTYEDFVRGIVAEPNKNGEGVLYKTENKILADFAEKAQLNYKEYLNTKNSLTFKDWTINIAQKYLAYIKDEIENKKLNYYLNNSSAYISKINKDSFTYNNDEWGGSGFELTFKEFYRCCMDDRLKVRLMSPETSLSKLAHIGKMGTHLLDDFWAFQDKQLSFTETTKKELKNYVLIIDEINRANLPSVLGELIYAFEYRGEVVDSMYAVENDNKLILPLNLYIIGTMNTADRSVGHIDYAIKRRFAFVDIQPKIEPIHPLIKDEFIKISSLFIKGFDGSSIPKIIERSDSLASDFRPEDIWIGHSYFICKKENNIDNEDDVIAKPILNMKLKYEIIPLLKEYIKDGILNETEQVKKVMDELISKDFTK